MSSVDNATARDDGGDEEYLKEQDRLLPIANVSRIMKQAVPSSAKIAKDSKETVQEASDRCQQEKRKTINGEDIVWAMESLGFDQYGQLMKLYLQKYKEVTKVEKGQSPPDYGNIIFDASAQSGNMNNGGQRF